MALTQTLTQLSNNVRKQMDIEGTGATSRHPDADVYDAVNRGLAALYRVLIRSRGEQHYLTHQTISTVIGTTTYALGATAMTVISVDATYNGFNSWLDSYMPNERPTLTDSNIGWSGRPLTYALRGDNIEILPTPSSVFTVNVWFVPAPTTLASGSDTFDTIARLDDYIIWWAARELATKDKAWDLINALTGKIDQMRGDIEAIGRSRDQNSPGRMVDETLADRTGRIMPIRRYRVTS